MTYDLNSHGFLAQFTVPDMCSFFVEQTLNSIRKQLVTPITFMPLFHQLSYLARTVVIVVHEIHSKVRLLMTFHPVFVKESSSTMKTSQ